MNDERGSALILALVVIFLLLAALGAVGRLAGGLLRSARSERDGILALTAAESGLCHALALDWSQLPLGGTLIPEGEHGLVGSSYSVEAEDLGDDRFLLRSRGNAGRASRAIAQEIMLTMDEEFPLFHGMDVSQIGDGFPYVYPLMPPLPEEAIPWDLDGDGWHLPGPGIYYIQGDVAIPHKGSLVLEDGVDLYLFGSLILGPGQGEGGPQSTLELLGECHLYVHGDLLIRANSRIATGEADSLSFIYADGLEVKAGGSDKRLGNGQGRLLFVLTGDGEEEVSLGQNRDLFGGVYAPTRLVGVNTPFTVIGAVVGEQVQDRGAIDFADDDPLRDLRAKDIYGKVYGAPGVPRVVVGSWREIR